MKIKRLLWFLVLAVSLCVTAACQQGQDAPADLPEETGEETLQNPGGLYLTDYMDMTVADIMDVWGEDVFYEKGWKTGATKFFRYEDGRTSLWFGVLDPDLTGYAEGSQEIYELDYPAEEMGEILWIAPGLSAEASYPELLEQGLSGPLMTEVIPGDDAHAGAAGYFDCSYSDAVELCFIWWEGSDPQTEPADLISLTRADPAGGEAPSMPEEEPTVSSDASGMLRYGKFGTSFVVPEGFIQEDATGPLGPYFLFVRPDVDMTISITETLWMNLPEEARGEPDYQAALASYGDRCTYSFANEGKMVFSGYEGDQIFYSATFYDAGCVTWVDIYYPAANASICDAIVADFMAGFNGY